MRFKFPDYKKIVAGLIVLERIHNTMTSLSASYASFVENTERKFKKKFGILRTLQDEIVDFFGTEELINYKFETEHKIQDPVLKSFLFSALTVKKVIAPKEGNGICLEDFYGEFDYMDMQDMMVLENNSVIQKFPFGPYFLAEKETKTGLWPSSITFVMHGDTPIVLYAPEPEYDTAGIEIDLLCREDDLDLIEELQEQLTEALRNESIVKNWVVHCDSSQDSEFIFHEEACQELRTGEYKFDIDLYNDEIKNLIQRDIPGFIEKQETFCEHGYDGRRAFMLEGPPGTGKSHIIRSIISILPSHYTTIVLDHKNIEQLAEISRYKFLFPALVIIEDIDLILGSRPRKQILLNFLDGLNAPEQMITIMTSNNMNTLTEAIIDRPGRVDRVIHVGAGDEGQRTAQISSLTRGIKLPSSISPEAISRRTAGFTVAQLRELIRRTAIYTQNFTGELSAEAVETVLAEFAQADLERSRRRQRLEKMPEEIDLSEVIESKLDALGDTRDGYPSWTVIKKGLARFKKDSR